MRTQPEAEFYFLTTTRLATICVFPGGEKKSARRLSRRSERRVDPRVTLDHLSEIEGVFDAPPVVLGDFIGKLRVVQYRYDRLDKTLPIAGGH